MQALVLYLHFLHTLQEQQTYSAGPYLPSKGLDTDDHSVKVLFLPQVNSLEGLFGGDAAALCSIHELVDIFHALEGHGGGLDLLDFSRLQGIDDPVRGDQSDEERVVYWVGGTS